jgi:hypothetical protein
MTGIVVDRVRATKTSWGGVLDCKIWPSTFWFEDTGSEGEGSIYPFRDEVPEPDDDRRCTSNVAVLSPEVDRPLLMGTPPALEGGWYDVGRGLLPCGIVGRAVGGLLTP